MNMLRKLLVATSLALAANAVLEQLKQPPDQRTWHGDILGVPYDFRPVTPERVQDRVWNPDNPSLFVPMVFGVGWTLNFYRLLHPASR